LVKVGHGVSALAGEPDADEPVEEEVNGVRVVKRPTWTPRRAYHVAR